jgi:hydrogenase maturation protein HypF
MIHPDGIQLLKIHIQGAVQGVGFRPFVYRLAQRYQLAGWVMNSPQGVFIEAEGPTESLQAFLLALENEKPAPAILSSIKHFFVQPQGYPDFEIRPSGTRGGTSAWMMPDIAVCSNCLAEVFAQDNRRFLYPFTNCTHCGPRYSIIEAVPYDRCNTTMKNFTMCGKCRQEYEEPENRRFHAQPNACPECGPHLTLWNSEGDTMACKHEALIAAVEEILNGSIIAVKGLGGFQLVVDAGNDKVVQKLREKKHREEKPFALMFPDEQSVQSVCHIDALEKRWLSSPESPIILLERRPAYDNPVKISGLVAPDHHCLGVMLPYTPLHHILLHFLQRPVVATSGNLADEPMCIDNEEAIERLYGIADFFLVHNRPIARHVDDSIGRMVAGRELVLRRSRGYAPLPVQIKTGKRSFLAVGAHLKNTIAVASHDHAYMSQHIGDLETEQAFNAFQKTIDDLTSMYRIKPAQIVCDMHPDYMSTKYAEKSGLKVTQVQHHYAHVLSCMAENEIDPPVLGVAWDGTGYGTDGTVWGGEFLHVDGGGFMRCAFFRPFPLAGGDTAITEPRRSALGLLYELYHGDTDMIDRTPSARQFSQQELKILYTMLRNNIHSPWTSSVGRLFDVVASLLDIQHYNRYEGQAAMRLEYLAALASTPKSHYHFDLVKEIDNGRSIWTIDWHKMIIEILDDIDSLKEKSCIAAAFHRTLAEITAAVADLVGEKKIVLSGGCFQNKILTETTIQRLQDKGYRVICHQRIPPNDGGLALGQVAAVCMPWTKKGQKGA